MAREALLRGLKGQGRSAPRPRLREERAHYVGAPWAYARDVFGIVLTPQQEEALDLIENAERVLLPSGNNLGKTYLLAIYGVYFLDAVAAQEDLVTGQEQGARILLPGPDHPTIYATIYSKMLLMAAQAEARGFAMPGRRSSDSVLWRVRPEWEVEAFSPPKQVNQQVAHTASGRHHRNQIALIEEGQGVSERVWRATEGMCSSRGNKIISSFNPTEPSGPAYQRARTGNYRVLHLDAFDHPNVKGRSMVVPGAIDFLVVDARVRECQDRGRYPEVQPDPTFGDYVYAAPPREVLEASGAPEEIGPRLDEILGHPEFEPHVWRPSGTFEAQVRGQWPRAVDTGLFRPGAWDAAVERWKASKDPDMVPDRVGVDAAREGGDETVYGPAWGETATVLVRRLWEAERDGDRNLVARIRQTSRIRVGSPRIAPRGDGPSVAQFIYREFPRSPWVVDETGVGTSVLDHAKRVLGASASGVSFAASPPERLPQERLTYNMRASLYVRAALALDLGLVDAPDDPLLREEILAHEIAKWEEVTVEEDGKKVRKYAIRITSKDNVKKKIGRSPDRADMFVLCLAPARTERRLLIGRAGR